MTWPAQPNPRPEAPRSGPSGRLTPLRVMQIVEIGVVAFRRHWRPLVAGTAVLATIPLILGDLAQVRLGDVVSADVPFDATSGLPQPIPSNVIPEIAIAIGLVIATELLSSAFLMLASLLASVYVGRDYRGELTRLSVAFAVMSRRAPVALAVWFLSTALGFGILALAGLVAVVAYVVFPPAPGTVGGLGALVALIAIVGGVVGFALVSIRFLVAPVVAVLEPDGPVKAMRRSWHLTGDNAWRTFGLVAAVSISVSVLVAIVAEFVALIAGALVSDSSTQVTLGLVIGIALALLTAPIVPVMETILYFDLRVRRDGLTLPLPTEAIEGPVA